MFLDSFMAQSHFRDFLKPLPVLLANQVIVCENCSVEILIRPRFNSTRQRSSPPGSHDPESFFFLGLVSVESAPPSAAP